MIIGQGHAKDPFAAETLFSHTVSQKASDWNGGNTMQPLVCSFVSAQDCPWTKHSNCEGNHFITSLNKSMCRCLLWEESAKITSSHSVVQSSDHLLLLELLILQTCSLSLALALTYLILWSWSDFLCRSGDVRQLGPVLPCSQINLLNTTLNHDASVFDAASDPSKSSLVGGAGPLFTFKLPGSDSLTVGKGSFIVIGSSSHHEIIVKLTIKYLLGGYRIINYSTNLFVCFLFFLQEISLVCLLV